MLPILLTVLLPAWPALADAPARPLADYLDPKPKVAFLDAIHSEATQKVLASQKGFDEFLQANKVPPEVLPLFSALYQVLSRAPEGPDKQELSHILPTAVHFIGEKLRFAVEDTKKFAGSTSPDMYNNPAQVTIAKSVVSADPAYGAHVLAHELEHVYDMYVGRHTVSESTELRGAKAEVYYFRLLKQAAPEKYEELRNSLDWSIRYTLHDKELCGRHLESGTEAFVRDISMGRCYHDRGKLLSRFSLVQELDPDTGTPAEVSNLRAQEREDVQTIQTLAERKRELAQKMDSSRSDVLEREFERADEDLFQATTRFSELSRQMAEKELQLLRLRRDLEWLRRKAGPKARIDAFLQVDKDYLAP